MDTKTFVNGYFSILTEAFEGPQGPRSAFLDQQSGLFKTLGNLAAERASNAPAPSMNTIAAHAEHTRFHLAGLNAFLRGERPQLDWAASWKVQVVDEAAWQHLQEELRQEYRTWRELVQTWGDWNELAVGGAFATLAHVAYHLGAMRQILRFLQAGEQA